MRLQKLSVRKILQRLSGTSGPEEDIRKLYKDHGYLEAYSKHTDLRVASNPHEAVGGDWEKIGKLQFEFLVSRGLRPHHRMLDIGCGTLRGGETLHPLPRCWSLHRHGYLS